MSRLIFKKLWLVSETTRAARRVELNQARTLLVGRNHTGKSTIVKNIFRTLGCETTGKSERWDEHAISVLSFDFDERPYTAFRKSTVFALRDDAVGTVRVTLKYSEWAKIMADLFDFRLMLPTHQETLSQATPPYLFLPFYMDQDSSWLKQWNSFDKLSQFTKWKNPLIAYITGQRPNGYYTAKFEETKAKIELNKLNQELGVVQSALSRVKKTLPRSTVRLDTSAFKQEILDLLRKSTVLREEQESLRKKVFEFAAKKEALSSQIAMARNALRNMEGDLKYLTETETEKTITCPTCGVEHESGFSVRLELIDDAVSIRKVISELDEDHRKAEEGLALVSGRLNGIKAKVSDIERTLQKKKGVLRLQDVIDSQSSEVVKGAFSKDIDGLKERVASQEKIAEGAKSKVGLYDQKERTKRINDFYSEKIGLFSGELGVFDLGDAIKERPDAALNASGSALPRSLLAYQFSILHTASEQSDSKKFPVVIDSPNQQGQDARHLGQMLEFIKKRTPDGQQLILAVEDMPGNFDFDGSIIELSMPFGLLSQDQYELACGELKGLVDSVEAGKEKYLSESQSDSVGASNGID